MKRKHRRLVFVGIGLCGLAAAAALVLSAFEENIVFFYSPSELAAKPVPADRDIRIGGLVEEASVENLSDGSVSFRVTDTAVATKVVFKGVLPDLFREGQGVVVQGRPGADGVFQAREVLAKHDETYMPPEVADAIKNAGQWKGAHGSDAQQ